MNRQVIKNRIRKILAYLLTACLFVLISAFLILQIPPVQNRLVGSFLKTFTEVTGFKSSIGNFRMLWFDRLELTNINIYDLEGNRMIGAREITINFKFWSLIQQQHVNVDGIYVDSAHVFLTKISDST